MKTPFASLIWTSFVSLIWVTSPFTGLSRVLDNFDDNTKSDWKDFTFVPGLGLPTETGGRFKFTLPNAQQSLFTASTKTSETFTLQDGRTVEFRTDLISGNGKDSFAVLAFIPTASSASTLAGYGLAKSTTDVLITKGIGKYFYNENPTPAVKNDNVTLVLSLTGKGANVVINAKVLDKDNNNAVIFDKTVVDTPAADILADGKDDPAVPYLGSGNFVLYCYEDFDRNAPQDTYEVVFDNAAVFVLDNTVLDNFNDNTKTDWKDFTFVPGLGLPSETGGQFKFDLPAAGQSLFTASTKTSRTFDLVDGERLELKVDLVTGNGKDAFAVLAFIPTTSSASTLAGYGFAKSTTDILITKGIGKYFYNEDPTPAIKNDNVTLVLSLTGQGTSVVINAKVLDKDNNNAVIFEKTVVDTPASDILADGKDDPAVPYLGSGNFVLFCYEDFDRNAPQDLYQVIFDNAEVAAPPAKANLPPVISNVLPAEFANFLAPTTQLSFTVADDKPLVEDKIVVTLNGKTFAKTNGLAITGTGNSRNVSLGGLTNNVNYAAELKVTDAENETVTTTLYFDTFALTDLVIEAEDYNFNGGQFIDNPIVAPEASGLQAKAYTSQTGTLDVDYTDNRTAPDARYSIYRENDPIRMQHSRDIVRAKFTAAGGAASSVYDYDVGDIREGEWLNYTRTFPAGTYEIYLREALINGTQAETVLEKVTGNSSQPKQTTQVLGSFLAVKTGFLYRNFPLTDGLGKSKIVVRLSGSETLRVRQVSPDPADGAIYQNYLVLVPVADSGPQRATVTGVAPVQGAVVETVTPSVQATIQNRDTTLNIGTIVLRINGQIVTPKVTSEANGATVSYALTPLPAPNSTITARLTFSDNQNVEQSSEWSFTVTYKALDVANRRAGPGLDRGFAVRFVQAPQGSAMENTLQRAEDQLAPRSTLPTYISTNGVADIINFNKIDGASGVFDTDVVVPWLEPDVNGSEDFAMEIVAYLDLTAGVHRFGVITDDGYKVTSGNSLADLGGQALGFHNGGPANETFDFVVPQAGLYPVRMVWYERGGAAYAEWFSVDPVTGERTLINDPAQPAKAVKAYRTIVAGPAVKLESARNITGPFQEDTSVALDTGARTLTINLPTENTRFFRISSDAARRIVSIQIVGGKLVLGYE